MNCKMRIQRNADHCADETRYFDIQKKKKNFVKYSFETINAIQ